MSASLEQVHGYSGTILFKDGRRKHIESSLQRYIVQLLAEHTGYSKHLVSSELVWLPRDDHGYRGAWAFRTWRVEVELDGRSPKRRSRDDPM